MKNSRQTYNSGFVKIYRRKKEYLTVNRNIAGEEDLEFIAKFAYDEMSKRQQDLEFAEQNTFSLSEKIKTQRPARDIGVDNQCFAIIGHTLYAIKHIDSGKRELFFYLEKIKNLEGTKTNE